LPIKVYKGNVFAQEYYRVNDADGYTNLRSDSCCTAPEVASIPKGDVCLESLKPNYGFDESVKWFRKMEKNMVDGGYYAEGYSDYCMTILSGKFEKSIGILDSLQVTDPEFVSFVIKHVDETWTFESLDQLEKNAINYHKKTNSRTCKNLIGILTNWERQRDK
jgi:hypothetical protein